MQRNGSQGEVCPGVIGATTSSAVDLTSQMPRLIALLRIRLLLAAAVQLEVKPF
jgi:hypothetical protein